MVLKRVEIFGFKSFADKTVILLEQGITGIVGPNGCGKSNIADSIKWVLGEQSARSLRGSSMEDVIFSGTDGRPPLHVAEVTLTFDNASSLFPIAFREVSVGRRLFRSGESEYLLNGERVRLKDVQDLLSDARLGRKNYTIMEQGRIDKILVSKPEERRTLFEEAAGIAKYRARRAEALRRLEATRTALARLDDLLAEIERQRVSYERAARKAQRYLERKERLRTLDVGLAARNRDVLRAACAEMRSAAEASEAARAAAEAEGAAAAADLEAARGRLDEAETLSRARAAAAEEAHARLLVGRAEITRLSGLEAAERAAAGRLEAEAERMRGKADEAGATAEGVAALLANLEALRVARTAEVEDAVRALAEADASLREAEERLTVEEREAREAAAAAAGRARAAAEAAADLLRSARVRLEEADSAAASARGATEAVAMERARLEGAAQTGPADEERCVNENTPGCRLAEIAALRREERRRLNEAAAAVEARGEALEGAHRAAEEAREAARWEVERADEALRGAERRTSEAAEIAAAERAPHVEAARRAVDEARVRREERSARWNDMRLAAERGEGEHRARTNEAAALRALVEDHRASAARFEAEAAAAFGRADGAAREAASLGASLGAAEEAHRAARAEAESAEAVRVETAGGVRAVEGRLRASEARARAATDTLHAARLSLAEHEGRLTSLTERLRERWEIDIDSLDAGAHPIEDEAAAEAESADLWRLLKGMEGDLNMTAAKDLAEATQRETFLRTQREDLAKAEGDLHEVVQTIDKHTEAVFRETFAAVANNFRLLFRRLFEGGEADLLLLDPEHPLECGIEIVAMPPGKKPQSISLLSGGERAMTAIAILFSIFLVRPSPFSILDELDAPLDEANVERFGRLLREFSKKTQFLVVTHNKRTMEMAETLYGVTQEERGVSKLISVRLDEALAAAS